MPVIVRVIFAVLLLLPLLAPATAGQAAGARDIAVLCYHDVGSNATNPYTVGKERLREHFGIIKAGGYQPVSLQQYLTARQYGAELPDKAVLLTFDDGYKSFYTDVYPLLKEYGYPAVLSVVTSWQQIGPPAGVGPLVSWAQMREMEASGLVTVASHSHALHRQVGANAFGDAFPAAAVLEYRDGVYETPEAHQSRILADFQLSQAVLRENLGHPVAVMTWPYGEYSQVAVEAAKQAGFSVFLALGDDVDAKRHHSLAVRRTIIYGNPGGPAFAQILAGAGKRPPLRLAQLDLDYLYDRSPVRFENNIDTAIYLLRRSTVNTVALQAFADDKGTGDIEQVYFRTAAAPVKADVFSHVAQRLRAEGFKVYAWMPALAGQWLLDGHPEDAVLAIEPKNAGWYRRASPFSPRVQQSLKRLFHDFAAYSPVVDGILFQDDLYLNDFEDASPAARAAFKARFGREMTPEALKDPAVQQAWARLKTETLNRLTLELANEVRVYRPQVMVARNIYAAAVLDPQAVTWLSQDFDDYLSLYDYAVVMAYPYMEKTDHPAGWLRELAQTALARPEAAEKVVFKLQTYDWSRKRWLSRRELDSQVKALKAGGAMLIGYYPLNVFTGRDETLPF